MGTYQPGPCGMRPGAGRWRWGGVLVAVCLAVAGCSSSHSAEVWGEVTFDGKPIPAGRIYFNPDVTKGNNGPQGYAEIHNGKFDTRKGGKGAHGGPTVIVIHGNEAGQASTPGSMGNPLFNEYQLTMDLPKGPCEKNFDVPAWAARDLQKPTGRKP